MKIVVFGATGSVGRHVIEQALQQGHEVTAFTRDRAKVEQVDDRLNVVQGDLMNFDDVAGAVSGQEAVIVTLGAGMHGGVRAPGTRIIIDAMQREGVRRLICQSTLGAGDSRGNLNFYWKYLMFGALLRAAYNDHQEQEAHVVSSGLDWTIVRPAAFTDGDRTGTYRHGFGTSEKTERKISRADVADFLLTQLIDGSYVRLSPGLSY
jgi:putative NADH-flavin reductase